MLYLDHCAATPLWPEVISVIADCMGKFYGNPSSLHRLGIEAESLLIKAREVAAASIGVKPGELLFTSCGTESNNMAVKGAVAAYKSRGRHIITSAIEHASVYEAVRQLEDEGCRVTYLPVDRSGAVRVEDVEAAITKDTVLVSIMAVNNETGRIQPVEAIGALLRRYPRIIYHVDAIQALGKVAVPVRQWNADLVSFSAHKLRGPKGVGFLYRREGVLLAPLLAGGGQEQGLRSGTENVPLCVGAAKAVRLAVERQPAAMGQMYELRQRVVTGLKGMPEVVVHGSEQQSDMAPHVVHFSCPGFKPEVIVHSLEHQEIYISTRSACASGEHEPSRVLLAMGAGEAAASSGLRVSFSADQTVEEMDYFLGQLARVLQSTAKTGMGQGGKTR